MQKLLPFFSAKNLSILSIESAKTVNEMTHNELVKLTTFWTTGPRLRIVQSGQIFRCPLSWNFVVLACKLTRPHSICKMTWVSSGHPCPKEHIVLQLHGYYIIYILWSWKIQMKLCQCAVWSNVAFRITLWTIISLTAAPNTKITVHLLGRKCIKVSGNRYLSKRYIYPTMCE